MPRWAQKSIQWVMARQRAIKAAVIVLAIAGAVAAGLFALLIPHSAPPPAPAPEIAAPVKPPSPWILAWSDEFAGTELDRTKWRVGVTAENAPPFGDSYLADNDRTVRVANGMLNLSAERIGPGKYSGAAIDTQGLASWQYGRFEARIKVARGAGTLTSFWMLHKDPTEEKWPGSGELDILEHLGRNPNLIEGVVHYQGVDRDRYHLMKTLDKPVADEFHDFALEWTPEGFFWFLDGQLVHAYPPHNEHPFNRNFFVILSLGVGGDWARAPDANTQFPVTTQVDWVRVYAMNPDYVRPEGERQALIAQIGQQNAR